jgi:hypothetical protein
MVEGCSEMIQAVIGDLHDDFLALRSSPTDEVARDRLNSKFLVYSDPFKGLNTPYQQNKYLIERGVLVQPDEYVIGHSTSSATDRLTHFVKPQMQLVTGQHVSIKRMLITLNNHTDLIE